MNSQHQDEASRKLYNVLPTPSSIRVLKLVPMSKDDYAQLSCTIHLTDLHENCLDFNCLSYTWGDPLFHYSWEKRSATFASDVYISCNDVQFKITDNLEMALRVISNQYFANETFRNVTPYLWVDSLCINQTDIHERNAQVRMMAQIYGTASTVISWLGPADADSDIAIPLIRQMLTKIDSLPAPEVDDDDKLTVFASSLTTDTLPNPASEYMNLARFYARSYFLRCWILQEIVLARTLRIFCGPEEIDFEDLQQVARVITFIKKYRQEEPIGQALALRITANRGHMHENVVTELYQYRNGILSSREGSGPLTFEFPQLIASARFLGCQNPRDKIYGILGVARPGTLDVTPDYDKTIEEVYSEAIRYWIRDTNSINLLAWVADKPRRRFPSCPSWVGELDVMHSMNHQQFTEMSTNFWATGKSEALPVNLNPIDFRLLTVRGKNIDQIVDLAEPWAWHGLGVGFDPLWTSMTLKLPKTYFTGQPRGEALIRTMVANQINGQHMDSIADVDAFKALVRRDTSFALIRQLHRLCWFSKPDISQFDYEKRALNFLQELDTLAGDDGSGFIPYLAEVRGMKGVTCSCSYDLTSPSYEDLSEPLSQQYQDAPPSPNPACLYITELQRDATVDPDIPAPLPESPDLHSTHKWNTDFSGAINHVMYLRRMARTQGGLLGLVPDSSQVGDSVWLLQGATVPFILRRAEPHDEAGDRERWEVMGDTYMHGVMHGEVWDKIQENELINIDLV